MNYQIFSHTRSSVVVTYKKSKNVALNKQECANQKGVLSLIKGKSSSLEKTETLKIIASQYWEYLNGLRNENIVEPPLPQPQDAPPPILDEDPQHSLQDAPPLSAEDLLSSINPPQTDAVFDLIESDILCKFDTFKNKTYKIQNTPPLNQTQVLLEPLSKMKAKRPKLEEVYYSLDSCLILFNKYLDYFQVNDDEIFYSIIDDLISIWVDYQKLVIHLKHRFDKEASI
ncbi:hypothetical protein ACTA71_002761 [Dictyostelium dimigraforme]